MTKLEFIQRHIDDLYSRVPKSPSRDKRIDMLIAERNKELAEHVINHLADVKFDVKEKKGNYLLKHAGGYSYFVDKGNGEKEAHDFNRSQIKILADLFEEFETDANQTNQ